MVQELHSSECCNAGWTSQACITSGHFISKCLHTSVKLVLQKKKLQVTLVKEKPHIKSYSIKYIIIDVGWYSGKRYLEGIRFCSFPISRSLYFRRFLRQMLILSVATSTQAQLKQWPGHYFIEGLVQSYI